MAKSRTPFFSFGSSGSIGNAVTSQKRGSETLLRAKPQPSYRYSLSQAYQRWLYEDYAHLWTEQTAATRAAYRSAGSRFHLTGFQYWMKYQLTNLPDILGYWKLDDNAGATAIDSSPYLNPATIFGASPAIGRIDGSLHLDGFNDYLRIPQQSQYDFRDKMFTWDFYLQINHTDDNCLIIDHRGGQAHACSLTYAAAGNLYLYVDAGICINTEVGHITAGKLHHINLFYEDNTTNGHICIDSVDRTSVVTARQLYFDAGDFFIGIRGILLDFDLDGIIDNLALYNRKLDQTTIERHSARRYPV